MLKMLLPLNSTRLCQEAQLRARLADLGTPELQPARTVQRLRTMALTRSRIRGGYSTVQICEAQDREGLYAIARAGLILEFTGGAFRCGPTNETI
jgi:hypothetical protein